MHQGHHHCLVLQYIDIFVTWGSHDLRLSIATSALALHQQSSKFTGRDQSCDDIESLLTKKISALKKGTLSVHTKKIKWSPKKNPFFEDFFNVRIGNELAGPTGSRGAGRLGGTNKKVKTTRRNLALCNVRRDDSPPHVPANLVTGRGL
jgi:hypothetical protein